MGPGSSPQATPGTPRVPAGLPLRSPAARHASRSICGQLLFLHRGGMAAGAAVAMKEKTNEGEAGREANPSFSGD